MYECCMYIGKILDKLLLAVTLVTFYLIMLTLT